MRGRKNHSSCIGLHKPGYDYLDRLTNQSGTVVNDDHGPIVQMCDPLPRPLPFLMNEDVNGFPRQHQGT